MEVFGARIKQARESLGWSQSELARRAGVPSAVLSRLESGARAELTLEMAQCLAQALGVGLDIIAGTGDATAEPVPGAGPAPRRRGLLLAGRPPCFRRSDAMRARRRRARQAKRGLRRQ